MSPGFRATIEPIADSPDRPLWSVMIPSYNCARFLEATLESVLAQDAGPAAMQIEVVDDASSDDTPEVVKRVGRGRVSLFRQSANVGQIANFSTCLSRSQGRLVHLLHGDDRVRPGFYQKLERAFAADEQVGAAFCRWSLIDEQGEVLSTAEKLQDAAGPLVDALAVLASEQRITTPSIAVRRSMWERLGGFDSRLRCAEDWEMWVRIAAHSRIWYDPAVLAEYRVRRGSTTDQNLRLAKELRYTAKAMELFTPLLPPSRRGIILRAARAAYASSAIRNARRYGADRDYRAMLAHLAEALRFSKRPRTLLQAALIVLGRPGRGG